MKSLFQITVLLTFSLIYGYPVSGQEKINLYGGLGLPEVLVLGARFQFDQVQLGLGIGSNIPSDLTPIFSGLSFSSDVSYHFGGISQKSDRRTWYIKGGLSKLVDLNKEPNSIPLVFYFRIGRDINLCKKLGLNIEPGIIIGKKFINEMLSYNHGIAPSFGIFIFYRI
jgi:hypothetical protein